MPELSAIPLTIGKSMPKLMQCPRVNYVPSFQLYPRVTNAQMFCCPRVTFVYTFCYVHFSWLVDLDLCIFSCHLEVLKNVKLILFLMFGRTPIFCQGCSVDVRFFSLSLEFHSIWFVSFWYQIIHIKLPFAEKGYNGQNNL